MLMPCGMGTRMIRRNARSSTARSISFLWTRISKRSKLALPSPHGLLRVVILRRLVGKEMGPCILVLVFFAMSTMLWQTSLSLSMSALATLMRAVCIKCGSSWCFLRFRFCEGMVFILFLANGMHGESCCDDSCVQ